jgi:hypothetical protein
VLLLVSLGVVTIAALIVPTTRTRLASIVNRDHPTNLVRVGLLSCGLQLAKDHPLLGVGAGRFERCIPPYRDLREYELSPPGTLVEDPHNEFLWMLAEGGVLGLLVILAVVFFAVRVLLIPLRSKEFTTRREATWAAGCLVAFAALCALRSPLHHPCGPLAPMLALGAMATLAPKRSAAPIAAGATALLVALFAFSLATELRHDRWVHRAREGQILADITGYAIPSICEPDIIQFKNVDADFVLHVEKDTVWQRFNEDKFWRQHNCILTEGSGQPPRGVRRLLHRLNKEHGLPIICLLDCDPWGHYIYSVIKQGSISLAFESERLAIPDAKFLGIRAKDYEECDLTDDVQIELNANDQKRAGEIAAYPWFKDHKGWQKEIAKMVSNGFKMEVESLITKDISYVTEEYVPQRLKKKDWLD